MNVRKTLTEIKKPLQSNHIKAIHIIIKLPALFIHGAIMFVKLPKHSISMFEQYTIVRL